MEYWNSLSTPCDRLLFGRLLNLPVRRGAGVGAPQVRYTICGLSITPVMTVASPAVTASAPDGTVVAVTAGFTSCTEPSLTRPCSGTTASAAADPPPPPFFATAPRAAPAPLIGPALRTGALASPTAR